MTGHWRMSGSSITSRPPGARTLQSSDCGGLLLAQMVEGVHHDNPRYASLAEGHGLRPGSHRLDLLLALGPIEHGGRLVQHHDLIHQSPALERLGHPAGAAAGVEHPAGRKPQRLGELAFVQAS